MAYILSIETSTTVCSVALHQQGKTIATEEEHRHNSHAEVLTLLIEKVLAKANITMEQLDALAVSSGPGSYTGLRIGVSAAKGICFALNKPLIAVPTLKIIAAHAKKMGNIEPTTLICPMIDARRMEVYATLYTANLDTLSEVEAKIITEESYQEELKEQPILFCGNGAEKCKEVIIHKNAIFISDIFAPAEMMGELAFKKFQKGKFEDVAYFEPFYLKNFVPTTPKKIF